MYVSVPIEVAVEDAEDSSRLGSSRVRRESRTRPPRWRPSRWWRRRRRGSGRRRGGGDGDVDGEGGAFGEAVGEVAGWVYLALGGDGGEQKVAVFKAFHYD